MTMFVGSQNFLRSTEIRSKAAPRVGWPHSRRTLLQWSSRSWGSGGSKWRVWLELPPSHRPFLGLQSSWTYHRTYEYRIITWAWRECCIDLLSRFPLWSISSCRAVRGTVHVFLSIFSFGPVKIVAFSIRTLTYGVFIISSSIPSFFFFARSRRMTPEKT